MDGVLKKQRKSTMINAWAYFLLDARIICKSRIVEAFGFVFDKKLGIKVIVTIFAAYAGGSPAPEEW